MAASPPSPVTPPSGDVTFLFTDIEEALRTAREIAQTAGTPA